MAKVPASKKIATTADWAKIARDRFGIGAPAAPAPVGSPPPDPVVAQPDPTFLAQVAANNLGYGTALGQLPGALNRASADYGYQVNYTPGARLADGSVDPNDPNSLGSYSVGGVDPSNPNSRAALLQKSYENNQRGNTTSLAARGQLYSGALQNAQDASLSNFNAQSAANQREFSNAIAGYFNTLQNARTAALSGNAGALGDLTNRLNAQPAPTTVTYAGVPYTPGTADQPFAAPVGAPTWQSALAAHSLLGTHITDPLPKRKKKA